MRGLRTTAFPIFAPNRRSKGLRQKLPGKTDFSNRELRINQSILPIKPPPGLYQELLKDCSDARKDIEEQVVNRYSYIFILN